jgi:CRP-like cAMP-binding protein
MNGEAPSDELITEIADELARELKRLIHPGVCFSNMRELSGPTEKLVYLYIWLMQPQTFAGIRRSLNLCKASLARVLRRLEERGLIVREGFFLYTIDKGLGDDVRKTPTSPPRLCPDP